MPGGATSGTATLITSLPYNDADTVPTTAGLWYRYTAPASGIPNAISVFAYAATLSNQRLRVFSPDAVTAYPASDPGNWVNSRPLQIMLEAGVTYYLNVYNQTGAYTLSVIAGPNDFVPVGALLVPNDVPNYPAAILSATDGHVLRFIHPFPSGETADVGASGPTTGRILAHSRNFFQDPLGPQTGGDGHLKLYSAQFELLADLPYIPLGDSFTAPIRWGRTSGLFYVMQATDPLNGGDGSVTTVTADGAFGPTTWNLSNTWNVASIAPSGSETILYGARNTFGTINTLAQWDLVNNVALPDLAPAVSSFRIQDLLVLGDDTILVAYVWFVANHTPILRRYAPDGTLLNTYTLTGSQSTEVRLARALNDPVSFWVWTRTNATESLSGPTTLNKFSNLQADDGTILLTFSQPQFTHGGYQGAKSATPLARFGAAESCPFLILREEIPPAAPIEPPEPPPMPPACVHACVVTDPAPISGGGQGCRAPDAPAVECD
ncbi:MAG: hypothetical protein DMF56_27205 [Acidobacteria bacterium]|nr:MAG: hypothetical protein DMF56_27205 [Acidobacteriota bacterium]